MWSHIDGWEQAAKELGVTLTGPIQIKLASADIIEAAMYFPNFGREKGTLVLSNYIDSAEIRDELNKNGYSVSYFEAPSNGVSRPASALIDLLSDGGWNGRREYRPKWILNRNYSELEP